MVQKLRSLGRDTRAATAIEYGLILAMIVLAIMVALVALGVTTTEMWDKVSTQVTGATVV